MIDKTPTRKPRSDGEQSRERLLLAAMRLFAEQGYARTSTREIALAAGANVAAISYYFGDKAGLYRASLTDLMPLPESNIEMFNQPHFTLRQTLEGFYAQLLAPVMQGELAQLCMRMWMREMIEPTGLWTEEIINGIKPEHLAMTEVLARHLDVPLPSDDVQRLVHAIAAMAVQLMIGRDVIHICSPRLMEGPDPIGHWIQHLVRYAEALVAAEKTRLQEEGKA
ncbi:CerR family C-terminal domain-containing protein [Massilia sp. NR 4-1]|uniref:CerR family C-terminal domain-containing protein n=1 Tax=Massilia sp. NR 4-1 TaxID=1678028 RepID=UPI00067D450D|nr:CerR family C-terminal domain-containing protein [Massilia sp. NR 4-1]AKU24063.1 TetR family transcriptional regulator [Massilia sp. NR 4-1]